MPQLPTISQQNWGATLNNFLETFLDNSVNNGGKVKPESIIPEQDLNVLATSNGQSGWLPFDQVFNDLIVNSNTTINQLLTPADAVMAFYRTTAPEGWLKANGLQYNTTQYPILSGVIQNKNVNFFGVDVASNTLNVTTNHGLTTGASIVLYSTNTLPSGTNDTTTYFVRVISPLAFQLHFSSGDATANTNVVDITSPGTGLHFYTPSGPSGLQATFNVPDLRANFIRGLDDGRGVDSGRTLGSFQQASRINITSAQNIVGDRVENIETGVSPSESWGGDSYAGRDYQLGQVRPRNTALLYCIKY